MLSIRKAEVFEIDDIVMIDQIVSVDPKRYEKIKNAVLCGECYVAFLDEVIVGYTILNYRFFDNGFIDLLMVLELFRNQTVGTKLIDYINEICYTNKLFTSTNKSNIPMQRLLAKSNFKFCGQVDELDEGDPELFYVFKRKEV